MPNELDFRKNQLAKWGFNTDEWTDNGIITGNDIDVAIKIKNNLFSQDEEPYCIWLETKDGNYCTIWEMLAQAIYTTIKIKNKINNSKWNGKYVILPQYLGCFDNEKCALIGKDIIDYVIELSSFDQLKYSPSSLPDDVIENVKTIIETYAKEVELEFYNTADGNTNLELFGKRLKQIQDKLNKQTKIEINSKNNVDIYNNYWKKEVAPLIKYAEFDENFPTIDDLLPYCYLADLMFDDAINKPLTISEKLDIVLQFDKNDDKYKYQDVLKQFKGLDFRVPIEIQDQTKYKSFWNKYKRPPEEVFRNKIIDRVDLLVSQDLRERNGDFFTPKMWVDRGLEYLNKAIGKDQKDDQSWLNDYYVWDCCGGTGNMVKDIRPEFQDKIFLSTLKRCHLRLVKSLGRIPNTPDKQIFQFDFLNDDWKPQADGGKIPDKLWQIIKETPEKLVIFINPPYVEATSKKTITSNEKHRDGCAMTNLKDNINKEWGKCSNELFLQFYYRIYTEIEGCIQGCFSKLKNILGYNFVKYRQNYKAKWIGGFCCPADTFDNVSGQFPIAFQIWKIDKKTDFCKNCKVDVYNEKNELIGEKNNVCINNNDEFLNKWMIQQFNKTQKNNYAWVNTNHGNDFSQANYVWFQNECDNSCYIGINPETFRQAFIYVSVFTCIQHTWLNDRDQFTAPFEKQQDNFKMGQEKHYLYEDDQDFINNCIVYAIFTKNYTDWCLFDNVELNLPNADRDLEVWWLLKKELNKQPLTESAENVYKSALRICQFYHQNKCSKNLTGDVKYSEQIKYKINASWNDVLNGIKGQKANKNGKLERCTKCEAYEKAEVLFVELRENLKQLAKDIEAGVYKYGFLRM